MLHADIYRVITMCTTRLQTFRAMQLARREFCLDATRQYMVRVRSRYRNVLGGGAIKYMIGIRWDGLYFDQLDDRIATGYYVRGLRHGVHTYTTGDRARKITIYRDGKYVEEYHWTQLYAANLWRCCRPGQNSKYVTITLQEILQQARAQAVSRPVGTKQMSLDQQKIL